MMLPISHSRGISMHKAPVSEAAASASHHHRAHYVKAWRHVQNWKNMTYYNANKGRLRQPHPQATSTKNLVKKYAYVQTHKSIDRQTDILITILHTCTRTKYNRKNNSFTAAPWHEMYWYGGFAWCHQFHICIHSCQGRWRASAQDARDFRRCFHVTASHSTQRQHLRHHRQCGEPPLWSQISSHVYTVYTHFTHTPTRRLSKDANIMISTMFVMDIQACSLRFWVDKCSHYKYK